MYKFIQVSSLGTDTSNRHNYFPFPENGNYMKLSQPIIATE